MKGFSPIVLDWRGRRKGVIAEDVDRGVAFRLPQRKFAVEDLMAQADPKWNFNRMLTVECLCPLPVALRGSSMSSVIRFGTCQGGLAHAISVCASHNPSTA